jgi:putative flippase GtrA
MKAAPKELYSRYATLFQYGIVGGVAALVEWAVFWVCNNAIGLYYILSTCIAFVVATLVNFLLASKFVFKSSGYSRINEVFLVYLFSAVGLGLNILLMKLFVDFLSFWPLGSKILSTGIVFLWNYSIRRFVVYRNREIIGGEDKNE